MAPLRKLAIFPLVALVAGVVLAFQMSTGGSDSALAVQPDPRPTAFVPEEPPTAPAEPAAPKAIDPTAERLLRETARAQGIPAERLQVGYYEEVKLPLTGVSFSYGKVLEKDTGNGYAVALNPSGTAVDADALRAAEREAFSAKYGKLHPALFERLQTAGADELLDVNIWLKMDVRSVEMERPSPEEARALALDALRAMEDENAARAATAHEQVQQSLLDFLAGRGAQGVTAPGSAPVVSAQLPPGLIRAVSNLPFVDAVYLAQEPEPQDGEKPLDPESALETIRQTHKSDVVEARGITGAGVTLGMVEAEDGLVDFGNPYLTGTTYCAAPHACVANASHATIVAGMAVSTHSQVRGSAPGTDAMRACAGGTGSELRDCQSWVSGATGQPSVTNHSWGFDDNLCTSMDGDDRWADYVFRSTADLIVVAAGNRGNLADACVLSPGVGYNVLTVGNIDDINTETWDDDIMRFTSSYNEPANREKPEITAAGTNVTSTLPNGPPYTGLDGSGTSFSAPYVSGGGGLLIDRDSALEAWPEAEKAILIATALHNIEGDARISEIDGAGAVDLAAADTVAANGWWRGHVLSASSFDANNVFTSMTITLYAGERVRVALAYDSNPSADYTSDPLEGDLDLFLLDSSGAPVASSAGVDSWEIIDYTASATGTYTVRIHNWEYNPFSGTESTFAGVAVWAGHYVLTPYQAQSRDAPPGAWNRDSGDDYRFTRGSYWNAVGLRPPSTADYDLYLFNNSVYGDPADHALRAYSTYVSPYMDIVAVDGDHAPLGDYYATVSRYSGTGSYSIEQATWTADLYTGTYGPYSADGDTLRVWDIWFSTGQTKYVAVCPASGLDEGGDLGVLLFDSDEATSFTWYQGRDQAVASADSSGAGGGEYLTHTSTEADWKGLVVFSKSGASTYNVLVDTSPVSCDIDGDGCTDAEELGPDKALGGQRDPLNPYDFYDITDITGVVGAKDKVVWVADLSMLLSYGGTGAGRPPNIDGKSYDADTNGNTIPDGREIDKAGRAGPGTGPDEGIGPADLSDLLWQGGDSCAGPP